MAAVNWNSLPRTISDPETIAEHVAGELATHNADDSAHGQSDEAIYNHRIAEIIDHLDESINNSKVKIEHRFYHAIFDSAGGSDFDDLQEAIDFVNSIGGGRILLLDGNHTIINKINLYSNIALEGQTRENTILDFSDITYATGTATFTGGYYATGTATFTNGSDIVEGAGGTNWLTQGFQNGDEIFDSEGDNGIIDNIIDDTHIQLTAPYAFGTGSGNYEIQRITSASAIITGIDTAWLSSNLNPGDGIQFDADGSEYDIESIDSDTQITLAYAYSSLGGSGAYTATIRPQINAQYGATRYSTGTITATQDDATVTGSGTLFLANVAAGDKINILDVLYEIASVTNNTHLELTTTYKGNTIAGLLYYSGTFLKNITIEKMTIQNASSYNGALSSSNIENQNFINLYLTGNYCGIKTFYSNDVTITNCDASNNTNYGIYFYGNSNSNVLFNNTNNNGFTGFYSNYLRSGNNIIGNTACANGSNGMSIIGNTVAVPLGNTISGNNCAGNGGNGMSVKDGIYSSITDNVCNNNRYRGISVQAINYSTFHGNNSYSNLLDGINLWSAGQPSYNTITANTCRNNTEKGIMINTGCTKNIVVANILLNNGTNLLNNGTLTELGHNISA